MSCCQRCKQERSLGRIMTAEPSLQIQGRMLRGIGFRWATFTAVLGDSSWHPDNLLCFAEFSESKVKVVMNRSLYLLLWDEGGGKRYLASFQKSFFTCWVSHVTDQFIGAARTYFWKGKHGGTPEVFFSWIMVLVRNWLDYNGGFFMRLLIFLTKPPKFLNVFDASQSCRPNLILRLWVGTSVMNWT